MKNKRQSKLLELIEKYDMETQDELMMRLREAGFDVTQATVSRDTRELKLFKIMTPEGTYKYVAPPKSDPSTPRFNSALTESIKSVDYSGNIVVLKTYPGMAQAVATGIDALDSMDILGCVAGDDAIIVVARNERITEELSEKLSRMIRTL